MNVITLDNYVAEIDGDAEFHAPAIRLIGVAFPHAFLDFDGTFNSIDDASEFDRQSAARDLDDAPATGCDGRLDQFAEMGVEPRVCPCLIYAHAAAIADHVSDQNCSKPSLDALFSYALPHTSWLNSMGGEEESLSRSKCSLVK